MIGLKKEQQKIEDTEYTQHDHEFYDPGFIFCWSFYFILHWPELKYKREYWQ